MGHQGIQELDTVEDIIDIVLHRKFYGLAHIGICREMHDRINPIFSKTVLDVIRIAEIPLVKITPFDCFPVSVDEVVESDGIETLKM